MENFNITNKMSNAIEVLKASKSGFVSINGYVPTTNYVVSPIVNINAIARFSTSNHKAKRLALIEATQLSDLKSANEDEALFDVAKKELLEGVRSKATNDKIASHFVQICDGVKGHYVTEKDSDGVTQNVLASNGLPTVKSLMIAFLEVGRKVVKEGEKKKVNKRAKTLVKDAIERSLEIIPLRFVSLKEDNFENIKINKGEIAQEHVF